MIERYPERPPGEDRGRIVLDTPGMRANVVEITGVARTPGGFLSADTMSILTQPVCTTPCVVDLPRGRHEFIFTSATDDSRTSAETIDLQAKPLVLKHAVGREVPHPWLKLGGYTSLIIGLTTAAISIPVFAGGQRSDGTHAEPNPAGGFVALGIGTAFTVLGGVLLSLGRTEMQPGATTTWTFERPSERPAIPATPTMESTRFRESSSQEARALARSSAEP
ncbi:hypothetical protein LZC95_49565 [Pendulispora brunnea]|uniref:Uncharacterized protein n=1 Tax=Pendulispora brunnea TaxID=2905690 RepID=A0ABZ2K715_9BACT